MIWGIDISDYQPDFDLHRARREGFDFVIIKSTEGSTWRGKWFRTHLDRARSAGMLVAAYHYVRNGDVAGQVRNIQAVVPRDCPVILDTEEGAGPLSVTRDLYNRLRAAGYRLPLLYLPKWWADKIGARDLRGFPPLWYSRYANNQGGYASQIWNRAGGWFDQFWGGYYGLHVEIMQFSDKATVAGRTPVDVNAYRGTREQLAALLGGGAVSTEEDLLIMGLHDKFKDWAGNDQTGLSWANHVDRRLAEIHAALLGLQKSRIPGDKNQTNVVNAVMDAASWTNQALGHSAKASYELTYKHPNRVDGKTADTMLGYSVNADKYGYENAKRLDALEAKLDKLLEKLEG